jgi:hypothetical protein
MMSRTRGRVTRKAYTMARERGKRKDELESAAPDAQASARPAALPDLARRLLSLGLSGFFFTEETIRRAIGETVPKDWTDFAVSQSERTRREFLERLSFEIAQSFEKVDVASVLRDLLEGRTLEVHAEIRLAGGEPRPAVRAAVKDREPPR